MAQVTAVSATYGRKLNLGNYNSVHAEVTLWANLEDGDDDAQVTTALRQMARNHVMEEMARVEPKLEAKVRDLFMGLEVAEVAENYDGDSEQLESEAQ